MRAPLKIVEPTLDGPREELRLAILEVEAAEAASAKSQALVSSAEAHLRAMQTTHARASVALSEATAPPRSLADRLRDAHTVDEKFDIQDAYNAEMAGGGPPAVTVDDIRRLRQEVEAADDEVVAARSALDLAHNRASPTTSALNRAKDRRQKAVYALAQPEVARLIGECQDLVERLGAARASLRYVAGNLLDHYSQGDDRRRAESFLCRPAYPEESGLLSENDQTRRNAALAAWTKFAEDIVTDASAPFPT